jgi:hypothetical protein
MNLLFTKDDLDEFLQTGYFSEMNTNGGGMNIPDMFSFWFFLKTMMPEVVIESGVYNGWSTKLIRKTLGPHVKIICLDPREIPESGFTDDNTNTIYYTGKKFIDFADYDTSSLNKETLLCFFDDHQNAAQRLLSCMQKKILHTFFNDNYPVGCGSHYSVQHLIDLDPRKRFDLDNQYSYSINTIPQIDMLKRNDILSSIQKYHVFPNIFHSEIVLWEGTFDCESFFKKEEEEDKTKYSLFYLNKGSYTWNTYIRLSA